MTALSGPLRGNAAAGGNSPVTSRPTPLFGRAELFEEVLRDLAIAKEEGGQFLLVLGQGGVGKSTLLRATIDSAEELGFHVLAGRALPTDLPEPFALIQDLVRSGHVDPPARSSPSSATSSVLPLFLAPYEDDGNDSMTRSDEVADEPRESEEANRLLSHLAN
ncbi:MAG: ATP-binding protein, partial [Thermoplasmata archaeon]|nr:ATP-binding protein [Thermoplasmata archaeon]